ncbi:hypothetical protein HK104_007075 [Borealophlyctis nickersoniae]|nr:hypothetical protein HK104_007075 [Borealophlyctis nickersoniae]
MHHMRKTYPSASSTGPKIAVADVTLAVEEGIVFGLLGPNGAGKTTLISILTGLYEASSGEARLAGWDTRRETAEVYRCIGVCPQFDILWDDLTCGETLYFYARLKGIPASEERAAVLASLDTVALGPFEHRLTKGLSGGEKRRLSIAIALVGRPKVVFLDEPTTGLDPEVRRLIWNIITSSRSGKTIILTTHSMEEAEVCCQRIGIMAKGTLRCLGSPLHLKSRYGRGFKLSFACAADSMHGATRYVEGMLTEVAGRWRKVDAFATNTSYEFAPREEGDVGVVFERMEEAKERVGVVDWGLSQTTLEEVFLRIISEADANAD